jgi:predicted nucleotidyltransferase component of viral defense system
MLHFETIEPRTFTLLARLQSLEPLRGFYLVGGTALALQYGHRKSVDLDLFTHDSFNRSELLDVLTKEFGSEFLFEGKETNWSLFSFIRNIKVDFINYPHKLIHKTIEIDSIRMYSVNDIAAMKINAILGQRKDFWDIAELLGHYKLEDLIEFHKSKYPSQMLLVSIPEALTYFEDAENSEDPITLRKQSWEDVKNKIRHHVNLFLK